MIGLPNCSCFIPAATQSARAPAILLPSVQTLRDNGTLAYTQISHKTYYKPEDMMAIVAVVEDKKKDMRFRKRTG